MTAARINGTTELGINFGHIRDKSLTVLNPLQPVDERIMDDADLAGPIIFVFCFGTCLLLVSIFFQQAEQELILSTYVRHSLESRISVTYMVLVYLGLPRFICF